MQNRSSNTRSGLQSAGEGAAGQRFAATPGHPHDQDSALAKELCRAPINAACGYAPVLISLPCNRLHEPLTRFIQPTTRAQSE